MSSIKVVSDLVCPWCYIGKRRLESALRQLPSKRRVSVSWHPFQLNPELPRAGMDRREYCTRKFGSWTKCEEMFERIGSVGKSVDLEFRFDLQPVIPNTLEAHQVIWLAGREGIQDQVMEALFAAYFCQGIDLSKRSNLIEVAAMEGLSRADVERMFSVGEGLTEITREELEIKALGISSVPLFIFDDEVAVSGAQAPETLVQAFEQAQTHRRKKAQKTQENQLRCAEVPD